jgi:hypothetical protein
MDFLEVLPNSRGAGDTGLAFPFAFERHRSAAADLERSA